MTFKMSNSRATVLSYVALILSLATYVLFFPFILSGVATDFYISNYDIIQSFYLISHIIAASIAITVYRKNKNMVSVLTLILITFFWLFSIVIKIFGLVLFGLGG